MSNEIKKHLDCANFCPIDAAKGICRLSENLIAIDSATCPNFRELKKCENCTNFKNPDHDNIGTCAESSKGAWAFGDLNATTCEGYKAN